MSTATLPNSVHAPTSSSLGPLIGALIAVWLALVFILGSQGAFLAAPGTPPLAIFLAVATPIALFVIGYRRSERFRDFVLGLDLRLLTGIQAWRFAGFVFIALLTYRILPGAFAWPAGLGDIAIGLSAPFVAFALARNPRIAASRGFVLWNVLGLLDLVTAVGTGTLIASGVIGVTDATIVPMGHLPMVLIPAFFVPGLALLHFAALIQARRYANAIDSL
ncbi:MAG TPA: hypothetical protein VKB41_16445 [Steroidobacteraceae bacterium]|nr:hypothetical protein [Steroidobacteraceae bacterium]